MADPGSLPHVAALLTAPGTDKPLLLAAIDAVAGIRPEEALEVLAHLVESDDEDIAEAVLDALALAGGDEDEEEEDDDDDGDWSVH